MTALLTSTAGTKINVGMGQIAVGREHDELVSVLGSCVGLVVLHPRRRLAVLAHVVLPASSGRTGAPGKFADTAVPEILNLLAKEAQTNAGLVAKLAGGAQMFGSATGPLQIGEANVAAITRLLERHNIRVIAHDLGGTQGRRISVDCQTGLVDVDVAGRKKLVL